LVIGPKLINVPLDKGGAKVPANEFFARAKVFKSKLTYEQEYISVFRKAFDEVEGGLPAATTTPDDRASLRALRELIFTSLEWDGSVRMQRLATTLGDFQKTTIDRTFFDTDGQVSMSGLCALMSRGASATPATTVYRHP
jgi:hypothetical protein